MQLTRFSSSSSFLFTHNHVRSFFSFAKDTKTLLIFHKSNLTFIADVNRSIECIDLRFLLNVNGQWKRTIVCSLTTLKIALLLSSNFFYVRHNKIDTVHFIDEQINKYVDLLFAVMLCISHWVHIFLQLHGKMLKIDWKWKVASKSRARAFCSFQVMLNAIQINRKKIKQQIGKGYGNKCKMKDSTEWQMAKRTQNISDEFFLLLRQVKSTFIHKNIISYQIFKFFCKFFSPLRVVIFLFFAFS